MGIDIFVKEGNNLMPSELAVYLKDMGIKLAH
jgi:hypothetical protein